MWEIWWIWSYLLLMATWFSPCNVVCSWTAKRNIQKHISFTKSYQSRWTAVMFNCLFPYRSWNRCERSFFLLRVKDLFQNGKSLEIWTLPYFKFSTRKNNNYDAYQQMPFVHIQLLFCSLEKSVFDQPLSTPLECSQKYRHICTCWDSMVVVLKLIRWCEYRNVKIWHFCQPIRNWTIN